jgi:hypothetical protein
MLDLVISVLARIASKSGGFFACEASLNIVRARIRAPTELPLFLGAAGPPKLGGLVEGGS